MGIIEIIVLLAAGGLIAILLLEIMWDRHALKEAEMLHKAWQEIYEPEEGED